MFFNIDAYLGRRFVMHWFINMFIGQALKEIFRVSRPKTPAIPMQTKWSNEYSLPSTHSMGSLSIAGTIAYFSIDR
jgi:sphingosine-1-phosphate phosphatase 1